MSLHITGPCIKGSCDFVDGIPWPEANTLSCLVVRSLAKVDVT